MIIYFLIYASLYSFPFSFGYFTSASLSLARAARARRRGLEMEEADTPEHFSACQFTPARCLCLAAITGADAQYWPRCNRRRPATEQQRLQRGTPSLARLAPPTSSASLPRATSSGASCRRRLSPSLPRERTHVGVCLSTRESNTYVRVCLRVHVYLCNISLS